jgi:hypothetical protein
VSVSLVGAAALYFIFSFHLYVSFRLDAVKAVAKHSDRVA